jgi:tetratricopeptide (TPR) repeat protein
MKTFLSIFLFASLSSFCFSQDADFYNLYFEGNALLSKGQYDKSIDKYNQALKVFKADYVYFNRGNAYFGKKDYPNALTDYTQTITMNKEYAEAYCQRGILKGTTGDKTGCEDLKKAIRLELETAKTYLKQYCR